MKGLAYILIFTTAVAACKKPYTPPAVAAAGSYLVVEGVINGGSGTTIIKLSRTVNLLNKVTANPVLGALVTVEGDQNTVYTLNETTGGVYVSGQLTLNNAEKYRVRITTSGNKQYLSDLVAVLNSPPIDSVTLKVLSNGINIYSNTHDPQNNTHYYRWDYQETWVIHSNYYSFYKSDGDTVTDRDLPAGQVYQCWQSDTSDVILLASSANLPKDVIVNNPVTFIEPSTGKLGGKYSVLVNQAAPATNAYSILVRQYALTADAYRFWTNLKSSTEQLGTIFDAQPTQLNGNIHAVSNPSEIVIGYISAGSITSQRIFIANQQIPATLAVQVNPVCQLDSFYYSYLPPGGYVLINQENEFFNYKKGAQYGQPYVPVAAIFNKLLGTIIGHTGSTALCVDCTLRGTNAEPVFWK